MIDQISTTLLKLILAYDFLVWVLAVRSASCCREDLQLQVVDVLEDQDCSVHESCETVLIGVCEGDLEVIALVDLEHGRILPVVQIVLVVEILSVAVLNYGYLRMELD